ncbi:hypothetical protein BDZ45DRAFT_757801, partial [Acephala macrosclerotiorum]
MLVYTAWYQRSEAKKFMEYNKRILDQNPRRRASGNVKNETRASVNGHPFHSWTLVHGFYAQMGGFALDTFDAFPEVLPETPDALYASDIYERLQISVDDILDKSKASGLAKSLVCTQALWFCIQCLSRVLQGLPITLLELNTFAHSISALIIYLLWWHKPLDVEQATTLPVRDAHAIRL